LNGFGTAFPRLQDRAQLFFIAEGIGAFASIISE
jgi:hypothetical protein